MNSPFNDLTKRYLSAYGVLKEDASFKFLESLNSHSFEKDKEEAIFALVSQLRGRPTKIEKVEPGLFSGLSKDQIYRIVSKDNIEYLKVFESPKIALKEYMGCKYIEQLNLSQCKHVEILHYGKIQYKSDEKVTENVFFISSMAKGVEIPNLFFQLLYQETSAIALESLKSFFSIKGEALNHLHSLEPYVLSIDETTVLLQNNFTYLIPYLFSSNVLLLKHPPDFEKLLNALLANLMKASSLLVQSDRITHRKLQIVTGFVNTTFNLKTGEIHYFDQGAITNTLLPSGQCAHFPEEAVGRTLINIEMGCEFLNVSETLKNGLQTTFINAYAKGMPLNGESIFPKMHFWILLELAITLLNATSSSLYTLERYEKLKRIIVGYIDNPSYLLKKWFS